MNTIPMEEAAKIFFFFYISSHMIIGSFEMSSTPICPSSVSQATENRNYKMGLVTWSAALGVPCYVPETTALPYK